MVKPKRHTVLGDQVMNSRNGNPVFTEGYTTDPTKCFGEAVESDALNELGILEVIVNRERNPDVQTQVTNDSKMLYLYVPVRFE